MQDIADFVKRAMGLLGGDTEPGGSGPHCAAGTPGYHDNSMSRGRIAFHALLLTTIVASFWTLDSLKDPVFEATVGMKYQPGAKLWSVLTTVIVVCLYDFTTGVVPKQWLFHIVATIYGLIFFVICALLYHIDISKQHTGGAHEGRQGHDGESHLGDYWLLGYMTYFSIESFGSLMVAMFWSFTNSLMQLEDAKDVYGVIISCAQVGAVAGSTFATRASTWGIPSLFLLGSMGIFSVSLLMKLYFVCFGEECRTEGVSMDTAVRSRANSVDDGAYVRSRAGSVDEGFELIDSIERQYATSTTTTSTARSGSMSRDTSVSEPGPTPSQGWLAWCGRFVGGFYEGLSLVLRHRYVFLLFVVSTLYEVVVTILDYQFKLMGVEYSTRHVIGTLDSYDDDSATAEGHFADLLGHFGQVTNFTAFLVSFFGFSYLVKTWGVPNTLLIFPAFLFVASIVTNVFSSMWVLFISLGIIKVCAPANTRPRLSPPSLTPASVLLHTVTHTRRHSPSRCMTR